MDRPERAVAPERRGAPREETASASSARPEPQRPQRAHGSPPWKRPSQPSATPCSRPSRSACQPATASAKRPVQHMRDRAPCSFPSGGGDARAHAVEIAALRSSSRSRSRIARARRAGKRPGPAANATRRAAAGRRARRQGRRRHRGARRGGRGPALRRPVSPPSTQRRRFERGHEPVGDDEAQKERPWACGGRGRTFRVGKRRRARRRRELGSADASRFSKIPQVGNMSAPSAARVAVSARAAARACCSRPAAARRPRGVATVLCKT